MAHVSLVSYLQLDRSLASSIASFAGISFGCPLSGARPRSAAPEISPRAIPCSTLNVVDVWTTTAGCVAPLGGCQLKGNKAARKLRQKARSFKRHFELQRASVKTELCEQSQDAACKAARPACCQSYSLPAASDSRTCKDAQNKAQLHDNTSPMLLGGVRHLNVRAQESQEDTKHRPSLAKIPAAARTSSRECYTSHWSKQTVP